MIKKGQKKQDEFWKGVIQTSIVPKIGPPPEPEPKKKVEIPYKELPGESSEPSDFDLPF